MIVPPNHGKGESPKSQSDRRYREELFKKQDGRCYWCGKPMELNQLRETIHGNMKQNLAFASFEHLVPISLGGPKAKSNRVLAHIACNNKRPWRQWPHDPVYGVNCMPDWKNRR